MAAGRKEQDRISRIAFASKDKGEATISDDRLEETPFPSQSRTKLLSCSSYTSLMDDKMAAFFYGGKQIKDTMIKKGHVKAMSEDKSKYIIALYKIENHTPNRTSYRMACAAASYYVWLNKKVGQKPIRLEFKYKEANVINGLAEAHGFPMENPFYYLYTPGLEFLTKYIPAMVLALLTWRSLFRFQIFSSAPLNPTDDTHGSDFKQAGMHIQALADKEGMSQADFIASLESEMETLLPLFAGITPSGSSRLVRGQQVWHDLSPFADKLRKLYVDTEIPETRFGALSLSRTTRPTKRTAGPSFEYRSDDET